MARISTPLLSWIGVGLLFLLMAIGMPIGLFIGMLQDLSSTTLVARPTTMRNVYHAAADHDEAMIMVID